MNARRRTPAFTRGDQERFAIAAPQKRLIMQIRVGYELIYECPQPTPMLLTLNTHFSRVADIVTPDHIVTSPFVPIRPYRDEFGNLCSRIVAPTGEIRISTDAVLNDSGLPDPIEPNAWQHQVQDLPNETLVFLLGSRYCDTDRMTEIAWSLFDKAPTGWWRSARRECPPCGFKACGIRRICGAQSIATWLSRPRGRPAITTS